MAESITSTLQELGFSIEHDWGRAVHAMLPVKGGDHFSIYVDTQENVFSLKFCTILLTGFILHGQGFVNATDLKETLLKNRPFFSHLRPDS